jgi:hypothetical protein
MSSSENCTTKTRRPRRARRHRAQHHDNQQGGQHGNGSFECGTGGWDWGGGSPLRRLLRQPPTSAPPRAPQAPNESEHKRRCPSAAEAGHKIGGRGETPRNPPAAGGVVQALGARPRICSAAHVLGHASARWVRPMLTSATRWARFPSWRRARVTSTATIGIYTPPPRTASPLKEFCVVGVEDTQAASSSLRPLLQRSARSFCNRSAAVV